MELNTYIAENKHLPMLRILSVDTDVEADIPSVMRTLTFILFIIL